ncbi:glycosyltransferase family 4 protein [Colwellia sp. Bg11-28]|uniref:glycosyltransferase family 4 protein n=1 Tax=Colwellia sp. Bg11-28 TaxID=2058305 RepID=UPI0018E3D244|nr:glycosyltransferase family 4 protein [Colwellia sp. Bg11-28]
MKTLVLTPSYPPNKQGGIDKVVFEFAKQAKLNGHAMTVISFQYNANTDIYTRVCVDTGFEIVEIKQESNKVETLVDWNCENFLSDLIELIAYKEFDCIVCHDWFLSELAIALCNKLGIPLISFIHAFKYEEYQGKLNAERLAIHERQVQMMKSSSRVICLAENVKRSISPFINQDIPIDVIRCGMSKPHGLSSIAPSSSPITYYYHGRFTDDKNVMGLLESFSMLSDNTQLVMRGQGKRESDMRKFIQNHDLAHRIKLLPWCKDANVISKDIQSSDVYVLASQYEPLGLSLMESIELGVPAVMPDCYGPNEIFNALKSGWQFSPRSGCTSLTNALKKAAAEVRPMRIRTLVNRWQCFSLFSWHSGYTNFFNLTTTTTTIQGKKSCQKAG